MEQTRILDSSFAGLIGVARRDITPPVGIYARSWGAATHDVAEGVHRPLTATALALSTRDGEPVILVALDLGWFRAAEDERALRGALLAALDLDDERLMVAMSHTHAGPSICAADADQPGGELIAPYLESVTAAVVDAAREALGSRAEGILAWTAGRCSLARNRDLEVAGGHACGFNPAASADDTVVVGRATDASGRVIATLVNYACHPTTLAWDNRLISPDYVGAMREVVEAATAGAPCLFLQGASGQLGPRHQYTGDTAVADRNGRILGHAAVAALESLLPPGSALEFGGVVESGTPLAVWRPAPAQPPASLEVRKVDVRYTAKSEAQLTAIERQWESLDERVRDERRRRRAHIRRALAGVPAGIGLWVWRVGDAVLVGQPNEAYSRFQEEVRAAFPERTVAVMNLVNGGGLGYLPEREAYRFESTLYQVWQSPFAEGCLEQLVEETKGAIGAVTRPGAHAG